MSGRRPTLSEVPDLLGHGERVFIIHRLGPHECEAVVEGTIEEVKKTAAVEVCGDNIVERIAGELSDASDPWDDAVPILIITIGGKGANL